MPFLGFYIIQDISWVWHFWQTQKTLDPCCDMLNMLPCLWTLSALNVIPRDLDAAHAANVFSRILRLYTWFADILEGVFIPKGLSALCSNLQLKCKCHSFIHVYQNSFSVRHGQNKLDYPKRMNEYDSISTLIHSTPKYVVTSAHTSASICFHLIPKLQVRDCKNASDSGTSTGALLLRAMPPDPLWARHVYASDNSVCARPCQLVLATYIMHWHGMMSLKPSSRKFAQITNL